jgi:hypothetical protein
MLRSSFAQLGRASFVLVRLPQTYNPITTQETPQVSATYKLLPHLVRFPTLSIPHLRNDLQCPKGCSRYTPVKLPSVRQFLSNERDLRSEAPLGSHVLIVTIDRKTAITTVVNTCADTFQRRLRLI